MEYFALESTIEFPIPLNTVDAVGSDGDAAPTFSVRKRGAASSAAATYTGTATLLSHANFNSGCYYASIPATAANGFEANAVYDVFCFADVGDATPTGYCGSFTLGHVLTYLTGDAYARIGSNGAGLTALGDTRIANLDATVNSRLAAASYTAPDNDTIGTTATAVNAIGLIVTAIQDIFSGMTSLPNWLRRAFRKDAGTAGMVTAQTEINTGGTSTFDGTTDNLESLYDKGITLSEDDIDDITTGVVAGIQAIPGFSVTVISPTDEDGNIEVRQGDAYLATNNRNIAITLTGSLPSLESACSLHVFFGGTKTTYTGTVVVNTATNYTLKFDLTGVQTAAMPVGAFTYEAEVTYTSTTNKWTPSTGQFVVQAQVA